MSKLEVRLLFALEIVAFTLLGGCPSSTMGLSIPQAHSNNDDLFGKHTLIDPHRNHKIQNPSPSENNQRNSSQADTLCPPTQPINSSFATLSLITYSTNCDYSNHTLYTLTCIPDSFTCAAHCFQDVRCSHFTFITGLNGGTCRLKTAPGSGISWATPVAARSSYICGYLAKRALFKNSLVNGLCFGLEIDNLVGMK